MTDLRLLAVGDISGFKFDTRIPIDELPERVILVTSPYDGDLPLPEGMALLLLTDNIRHARSYLGRERCYVVFVGSSGECGDIIDSLYDIWSPSDGSGLIYKRYKKAVGDLRKAFDADFYERTLLAAINSVPDMIWFRRRDGIHTLVNDRFCEVVHRSRSDIIGKDHDYIWDDPDTEEIEVYYDNESEETAISTGATYVCDEPVHTPDGMKQFTTYKTPLYDMFGNIFGTVGVGHDVTDFSSMDIELSILVENLPFPMTIFAADWSVIKMNGVFAGVTGAVTEAQQHSFDYKKWRNEELTPVGEITEDEENHTASREYLAVIDGEKKNLVVSELEIRDHFDNISGYYVTMTDITFEREYERSILEAANTDMLTGLCNRRYFYSYLAEIRDKRFTLLYMDLDRFKQINDNFGHASGDDVLIKTAELIRWHFPEGVCFRLGGDEFAVIDDKTSAEELAAHCKNLETDIREAFEKYGFGTGISIGVSESSDAPDDIDNIFRKSDEKMYEIKKKHHDAQLK